jgi:long-chain acyl-CoA synthetase
VIESLTHDFVFVGREKDTIVLLNGENVEPEPIELALENIKFVKHAMVIGQDKEELSVLIVPDFESLQSLPDLKEICKASPDEFIKNAQIIKLFKEEIKKIINTKNGFKIHEHIKNIILLKDDFEPGTELTNTMKKKRNVITTKYNDIIDKT